MKTLKAIQIFSKIGKVLSKIVNICCIIGFIGCIVGVVAMLVGGHVASANGTTLNTIFQTEAGTTVGVVWIAIAVGLIFSISEFIISHMAYRYFKNELEAGTPFTVEGGDQLCRLGISVAWISIAAGILGEIAQGIISEIFTESTEFSCMDFCDNVALGIAFIIVSLLCKYGAELEQKNLKS